MTVSQSMNKAEPAHSDVREVSMAVIHDEVEVHVVRASKAAARKRAGD
jgi:hypothetical protein